MAAVRLDQTVTHHIYKIIQQYTHKTDLYKLLKISHTKTDKRVFKSIILCVCPRQFKNNNNKSGADD